MSTYAGMLGAESLLTPGIRAEFNKTYLSTYKAQNELMGRVMNLDLKSDKRYEIYAYLKAAPYPMRWDLRTGIPEGAMGSVQWQTYNDRWARRVKWLEEDEQDDQTGSVFQMANDVGKHFGTLDERVFFQVLQNSTDGNLLKSVPNAPDGVALYYATDSGGSARFGVTGGNLISGASGPTAADIRDQYHDVLARFSQFLDTESEPLLDPSDINGGMMIIYGPALTQVMREAFEQRMVVQNIGGGQAAAAPSNVIIDAGDNVQLWRTVRLGTSKNLYFVLTKPSLKPIYRQERTPVKEDVADRGNSDFSRDTNGRYLQWHCRRGYGVALPYSTIKVTNT